MSGDIVQTVPGDNLFSLNFDARSSANRAALSISEASSLLDLPMDAVKALMHFGQLNYRVNVETKQIEIERRSVVKFLKPHPLSVDK
jgi:hypothetical protein